MPLNDEPPFWRPPLGYRDTGELIDSAAAAQSLQLPLEEALEALAEETTSRRLAHLSRGLAEQVRSGKSFDDALAGIRDQLPRRLRSAFANQEARISWPASIEGIAHHESVRRRLRNEVQLALVYPTLVLGLMALLSIAGALLVVPQVVDIFADFGMQLPLKTVALITVASQFHWVLLALGSCVALCLILSTLTATRRLWHWLRNSIPFVGKLWQWMGHHEFASLMASLTEHRVPLEQALSNAEAALADRNLARAVRIVMTKCEQGKSLATSMGESIHWDPAFPAIVGWGVGEGRLGEAWQQAVQLSEDELHLHSTMLRRILPSTLLVLVTLFVGIVTMAVMLPMIGLINGLSVI